MLLVDSDERVREGFSKLLSASGMVITAIDDIERAIGLARDKYFDAAVIDVDSPTTDAGFETLNAIAKASPQTKLLMLSTRQTFDIAARAFRLGAVDIVVKSPQNVPYLVDTVSRVCEQKWQKDATLGLLRDAAEVHEQFLERLMDVSRKALAAQDRASGTSSPRSLQRCVVLVVDDNARNAAGLQHALGEQKFKIVSALTGGEALDCAGTEPFQIAMVKEQLVDLPASMVITGLKSEVPEGIVMTFTPPTDVPGRAVIVEGQREIELIPKLERGEQLVERLHELAEAYVLKQEERRHLQKFRQQHYEFLRRYVELKQRLDGALASAGKAGR